MTATADTSVPGREPGLPWRAQLYLLAVGAAAVAGYLVTRPVSPPSESEWRLAIILAALAAVAQLFVVVTTGNQSYHLTPGIVLAAAILLPLPLVALVVVVQHVPEWLKARYPWFIQTFNIANYALAALTAAGVFELAERLMAGRVDGDVTFFAAGLAAAVAFVAVQHMLLALVLMLARGHSLRGTGLFTFQSLSMETVLAVIGVVVAALWDTNPLLIVFALSPLFMLHRTLALPKLEAEAQQDPKTGLYNARHFSTLLGEAAGRAQRLGGSISLLVADLDLLREINNRYGHLAGDAVLSAVAGVLQRDSGRNGVAARFGGEEFCVLLPDTDESEAVIVAERIREAVAQLPISVDTSSEPISATISIGVASLPDHASSADDLLHRADVCAYRAKAQGRNRVVASSSLTVLDEVGWERAPVPAPASPPPGPVPVPEEPALPHRPPAPNHLSLPRSLRVVIAAVASAGCAAGLLAVVAGSSRTELVGSVVLVGLVAIGQAVAVEALDQSTISLSAVGSLAGAALFGPEVALPIALAVCAVEWSAKRTQLHQTLFNVGALTLSGLASAGVFALLPDNHWAYAAGGALAGAAYYAVNIGLLTTVISLETGERWLSALRERFAWLFVHYLVYGVIGAAIALAYDVAGVLALVVFAVPLILVRKSQLDYVAHTEAHVKQLGEAARTIEAQNESLLRANALLRERATEAMESLAAAVDARDAYTAGHSRRVQRIAVEVGRELGLDQSELESLSFAALFHDVGKLAVPDSVLLKPAPLQLDEWWVIKRHAAEGERIIGHLGFLADATPAIRHHHEHFDGSGYPDGLAGEAIPIGARIIHVADAFDSMSSNRVYRDALSAAEALAELRSKTGSQFCPRCIGAFERAFASGTLNGLLLEQASSEAA
jgi:diguanylate cyclase (GGDEF)-like protein